MWICRENLGMFVNRDARGRYRRCSGGCLPPIASRSVSRGPPTASSIALVEHFGGEMVQGAVIGAADITCRGAAGQARNPSSTSMAEAL